MTEILKSKITHTSTHDRVVRCKTLYRRTDSLQKLRYHIISNTVYRNGSCAEFSTVFSKQRVQVVVLTIDKAQQYVHIFQQSSSSNFSISAYSSLFLSLISSLVCQCLSSLLLALYALLASANLCRFVYCARSRVGQIHQISHFAGS